MYCGKCGAKNNKNSVICKKCKEKLDNNGNDNLVEEKKSKKRVFVIVFIFIILLILTIIAIILFFNLKNGNQKEKLDIIEKSNVEDRVDSNITEKNEDSNNEKQDSEENNEVTDVSKEQNTKEETFKSITEFTDFVDKNEIAQDANGNKIIIPKGFKVLVTEGVVVQEGIVIKDQIGNEFVWIPVGYVKDNQGNVKLIELARRKFDQDGTVSSSATDGSSLPSDSYNSEFEYSEVSSKSSYGNTKAKDITKFMDSVNKNNGYYIARYEAGNNKGNVISKSGVAVWNNITQLEAAKVSQKMYDNDSFESDLINSYAWDTAIYFIQTYSDNLYSMQTTINDSLSYTGEREKGTTDKMANIYDMASNVAEWTTETQLHDGYYCVHRGGNYKFNYESVSSRSANTANDKYNHISFRTIIYIK